MSTTSKLVNCFHYAYEAKSPILLQCPLQGSLTSCNPMLCLCSPPLPSLILLHTYDLCEFQLLTSLLPQGGFLLLFSTGASDPATPIASSKNNLKPKRVLKNVYPRLENNMMNSIRNTHTLWNKQRAIPFCPTVFPPELVECLYPQHRNHQMKNPDAFKNLFSENQSSLV